jgi:hypothetical protein
MHPDAHAPKCTFTNPRNSRLLTHTRVSVCVRIHIWPIEAAAKIKLSRYVSLDFISLPSAFFRILHVSLAFIPDTVRVERLYLILAYFSYLKNNLGL